MDERDGFYFHRSFWESISLLAVKDQLPLLKALIEFGLDGKDPEKLTNNQKASYLLIRPVLQKGRNKAASGRKGGSKREAKRKQTESKNENASPLPLSDNKSDKGVILTDYDKGLKDEGVNDCVASAPAPAEGKAFTQFWEGYPNRIGRDAAWEAWKQLRPDVETVGRIMAGLDAWKRSENWEEANGRFIPRAARFLKEKHWESPPAETGYASGGIRQPDQEEIMAVCRMMGVEP